MKARSSMLKRGTQATSGDSVAEQAGAWPGSGRGRGSWQSPQEASGEVMPARQAEAMSRGKGRPQRAKGEG